MSIYLEISLFLASVSVIVLVICLVPVLWQIKRQLERLAEHSEQLKNKLDVLVSDSDEMVRNVNELVSRTKLQMDTAGEVVDTVRQWTDRADRLIEQAASVVEPPVFALAKKAELFRRFASTFLQVLFRPKN